MQVDIVLRRLLHPRQPRTDSEMNVPFPKSFSSSSSSSIRHNLPPVIFLGFPSNRPAVGFHICQRETVWATGEAAFSWPPPQSDGLCFPSRVSVCSRAAVCKHAAMLRGSDTALAVPAQEIRPGGGDRKASLG